VPFSLNRTVRTAKPLPFEERRRSRIRLARTRRRARMGRFCLVVGMLFLAACGPTAPESAETPASMPDASRRETDHPAILRPEDEREALEALARGSGRSLHPPPEASVPARVPAAPMPSDPFPRTALRLQEILPIDERTLIASTSTALYRIDLGDPVPRPLQTSPPTGVRLRGPMAWETGVLIVEGLSADGSPVLLLIDERSAHLRRLDFPKSRIAWTSADDTLWIARASSHVLEIDRMVLNARIFDPNDHPERMGPAFSPPAIPRFVAARGSTLVVGTESGALLALGRNASKWTQLAPGGADGLGTILSIAPWQRGFALSSSTLGLARISAGLHLDPLDGRFVLDALIPQGQDVLGLIEGRPCRFNTRLRSPVCPAHGERFLSLKRKGRLLVGLNAEGIHRIDPIRLEAVPVLRITEPRSRHRASPAEIDTLIRHIAKLTPSERRAAYARLLDEDDADYEEIFLVGLNEDDPLVLEVVTEYFRVHHPAVAIDPLLEVLLVVQGDVRLRDRVARVIAAFGPACIPAVVRVLGDANGERLAGGAKEALEFILARAIESGGIGTLNAYLEQAGPAQLLLFAETPAEDPPALGMDERTIEILRATLEDGRDRRAIEASLRIISRLARHPRLPPNTRDLVPALVALLRGPQRKWALYALALINDRRAVDATADIVRSDPRHRFWAMQALSSMADRRGDDALLDALDDKRPEVRAAAAFIVQKEGIAAGAARLRAMLEESDDVVCLSCIEALASFHDDAAVPLFLSHLPRASADVQRAILRALCGLGTPEMASRFEGWAELELLAPIRRGRRLDPSTLGVLNAALALIAVHGRDRGLTFVRSVARRLPIEQRRGAEEAVLLGRSLPLGLDRVLTYAILGPPDASSAERKIDRENRDDAPVSASHHAGRTEETARIAVGDTRLEDIDRNTFVLLREQLFRLVGPDASPALRRVLERIMLEGVAPADRQAAIRVLDRVAQRDSIPALIRALGDPYFQNGPFPYYRYPVRHMAARTLQRLGVAVVRHPDRSYEVLGGGGGHAG